MKRFDEYPKSFKKMVRFIRQEATIEQIRDMELIFADTVALRRRKLEPDRGTRKPHVAWEGRGK
ncbi:hypothetical protein [Paenibacillus ginsengarvi]|uniref:Uncharacterized protein n=1 Tax=Paenibacillus ginsengarvi TaxID=400777 RepID=A0A3B0CLC2_9BACL|nr:hypothetical protein [Paenibacillus ginsengarvi]RKN86183.1 hypothetical protein D7M11_04010 [Paenibacillus ginsengarvi]